MDYKKILTNKNWWPALLIILVTFLTYYQVLDYDFVNFDDDIYVYENTHLKSGFNSEEILFFFTNIYMVNWIPLTLLSHMMDVQVFGLSPGGHHFTSLAFHILNSLLLFFLLKTTTNKKWPSFVVAMLFAVHPLHVESVAWISERKDALSTFFRALVHYFLL